MRVFPDISKEASPKEEYDSRSNHSLHKKMKFSINDFFGKCDQIRRKLWIWSVLLKKSIKKTSLFDKDLSESLTVFKRIAWICALGNELDQDVV